MLVTADGEILTVNDQSDPDLIWALRGGGGGTFGVAVSVTYKSHPFRDVKPGHTTASTINCPDADSFEKAVASFAATARANLINEHWGGVASFQVEGGAWGYDEHRLQYGLSYYDRTSAQALEDWQPLLEFMTSDESKPCTWSPLGEDGHAAHACNCSYPLTYQQCQQRGSGFNGKYCGMVFQDYDIYSEAEGFHLYPTATVCPVPSSGAEQCGGFVRAHDTGDHPTPASVLGEINNLWMGYTSRYVPVSDFEQPDLLAAKITKLQRPFTDNTSPPPYEDDKPLAASFQFVFGKSRGYIGQDYAAPWVMNVSSTLGLHNAGALFLSASSVSNVWKNMPQAATPLLVFLAELPSWLCVAALTDCTFSSVSHV